MNMTDDKEKLIELLDEELDLTPYESKAYIAILLHGPLSPQGVNQKSGVPRPRAYDVLNSLVGKGLLMEQPGKPRMYAAVDPRIALDRMLMEVERKMLRQLEDKKKTVERLSFSLSKLHDKSLETVEREERVWVTRRDSAFFARYCEEIRNIEHELVVATPATSPPEKEVLEAIKYVLKRKKTVRVLRQISPEWTREELENYEELIRLGDQVKHLSYDGLRFAIFDKKDTVLALPPEEGFQLSVWISLPSLSVILYEYFEKLWKRGQPALPIVRELKKSKT